MVCIAAHEFAEVVGVKCAPPALPPPVATVPFKYPVCPMVGALVCTETVLPPYWYVDPVPPEVTMSLGPPVPLPEPLKSAENIMLARTFGRAKLTRNKEIESASFRPLPFTFRRHCPPAHMGLLSEVNIFIRFLWFWWCLSFICMDKLPELNIDVRVCSGRLACCRRENIRWRMAGWCQF